MGNLSAESKNNQHIIPLKRFFSCRYEQGDFIYIHSHNYWEFMLITSGTMIHKINDSIITLDENTLCLIRPNDRHMIKKMSNDTTHINFIVSDEIMKKQVDVIDNTLLGQLLEDEPIATKIPSRSTQNYISHAVNIQSLCFDDPYYNIYLSQVFMKFFQDFVKYYLAPNNKNSLNLPKPVIDVINVIMDNNNLNKPLSEIIKVSGYSYVHIARMFKEHVKMTLSDYFVSARMNCARKLLEYTDKSILEISSYVGYNSLSHFNHTFRSYFKITPSKYRKDWKEFFNDSE